MNSCFVLKFLVHMLFFTLRLDLQENNSGTKLDPIRTLQRQTN